MITSYAKRFYYLLSLRFTARAFSAWKSYIRLRCLLTPLWASGGEDRFYAGIPAGCGAGQTPTEELRLLFLLQNLHEGK